MFVLFVCLQARVFLFFFFFFFFQTDRDRQTDRDIDRQIDRQRQRQRQRDIEGGKMRERGADERGEKRRESGKREREGKRTGREGERGERERERGGGEAILKQRNTRKKLIQNKHNSTREPNERNKNVLKPRVRHITHSTVHRPMRFNKKTFYLSPVYVPAVIVNEQNKEKHKEKEKEEQKKKDKEKKRKKTEMGKKAVEEEGRGVR